jgi:hypothetical protein
MTDTPAARPLPDGERFPSAKLGTDADCACDNHAGCNASSPCKDDPVCVCKAGSRSLRPFASYLNGLGLRLGLWTWRGVHLGAAQHKCATGWLTIVYVLSGIDLLKCGQAQSQGHRLHRRPDRRPKPGWNALPHWCERSICCAATDGSMSY